MYEMKIVQYGEFESADTYNDLEALLHELENIAICRTAYVDEIKENGIKLSRTKIRILQSWAETGSKPCLGGFLRANGCL